MILNNWLDKTMQAVKNWKRKDWTSFRVRTVRTTRLFAAHFSENWPKNEFLPLDFSSGIFQKISSKIDHSSIDLFKTRNDKVQNRICLAEFT